MIPIRWALENKMLIPENNFGIILFDGVCNFCNASVNNVIKNDKKNYFKFAALQSETGKKLLEKHGIDSTHLESVVLIENNVAYQKSAAALRIVKKMDGLYPLLFGLIIIPTFIRNFFYDFIARNRYKWFGEKEVCLIPTDEIKEKFIS